MLVSVQFSTEMNNISYWTFRPVAGVGVEKVSFFGETCLRIVTTDDKNSFFVKEDHAMAQESDRQIRLNNFPSIFVQNFRRIELYWICSAGYKYPSDSSSSSKGERDIAMKAFGSDSGYVSNHPPLRNK